MLCEIPVEETVRSFNTLWVSAGEAEFLPMKEVELLLKEVWLRMEDASLRVIVESKAFYKLYIGMGKVLKEARNRT